MANTYDYIVVGAGSAGAAVATRLSENGQYTVLCLEAGTEGSDYMWSRIPVGIAKLVDNPAVNWCYRSEPDEGSGGREIEVPRGKMLGGSSSINGMVFIRGQAQDYDHWAQLGNRGWSYQDVLPLFKKMESFDGGEDEFRGRDGPLRVTHSPRGEVPLLERIIQAAENIGLPYNPDQNGRTQEGVSMSQTTIAKGRRQSTAYCYLDPARDRKNLTIEQGAMALNMVEAEGPVINAEAENLAQEGAQGALGMIQNGVARLGSWIVGSFQSWRGRLIWAMSATLTTEQILAEIADEKAGDKLPKYDEFAASVMAPVQWPDAQDFEVTAVQFNGSFQTFGDPKFAE